MNHRIETELEQVNYDTESTSHSEDDDEHCCKSLWEQRTRYASQIGPRERFTRNRANSRKKSALMKLSQLMEAKRIAFLHTFGDNNSSA
jgi:hypothetical protein